MTLHQWLAHMRYWLRDFPRPWSTYAHVTAGPAGRGPYVCLLCGWEYVDDPYSDEDEDDEPEVSP